MNHYVEQLNLGFDPFAPPDPDDPDRGVDDFFAAVGHRRLLERWRCEILEEATLRCVTGPFGVGKSTLARAFCEDNASALTCLRVTATLFLDVDHFVRELQQQLVPGEPLQDQKRLQISLRDLALTLELEGRALVLLVDDAHELANEVLQFLAQLYRLCNGRLSILMLGEEQTRDLVAQSFPVVLLPRIVHEEIGRLSSEETLAYVRQKLRSAGYTGPVPLRGEQLQTVHELAGGLPASINRLLAEALLEETGPRSAAPAAPLSWFSAGKPYWSAAAALSFVLLGTLLIGREGSSEEGSSAGNRISIPVTASGNIQRTADADAEPALPGPPAITGRSSPPVTVSGNDPGIGPPSSVPGNDDAVAANADQAPTPAPAPADAARNSRDVAPQKEIELAPFATALLAAPAESFTIQVMGTRSEENARLFAARHFTTAEATYYAGDLQGQPWYVVVYGRYSDRDSARDALQKLPAAVRELEPWVRPVGQIQQALRQTVAARNP